MDKIWYILGVMASTVTPDPPHAMLPRLAADDDFAAVRQVFHSCGYDERGVVGRLEIEEIARFKSIRQGRRTALDMQGPIDVLIRLFLDGEIVQDAVARTLLPEAAIESLAALNLVAPAPGPPGAWLSTVLIYPGFGLLMTSDRAPAPNLSNAPLPPDAVYPAVIENTREFIAALPETACEALLDIGTGSGIAALLAASRYARHAWGADITPRAVHFAEFNRRLNGLANASFVAGDMYAPVEGMTFDRIVAHPPYVPAAKTRLIYRDGGEDGEQILRRAVEGLPRFLRPGGSFRAMAMAADCEGETFEQRIRKWLGASECEFDLVLVSHWLREPALFIANTRSHGDVPADEVVYLEELWKRRKVQFLFHGRILLRRFAETRPAVTARVQKGNGMTRDHVEWLLDWETRARNRGSLEWLMGLRPSIAPQCRLAVQHVVHEGRFAARDFVLSCPSPFDADCRVEPWLAALVSACDGRRTVRDHFEEAARPGQLQANYGAEDFAAIVVSMLSAGILAIE
jgi:methylase of polypeptide subunit release factors